MKDTTKLMFTATYVFLLLCILTTGIYAWFTWKEPEIVEEKIPQITEEFDTVSFKSLKTTTGEFYLNTKNEIVEFDKDVTYYIGTFGKLYDNKIKENNEYTNEPVTYKNYKIYYTDKYDSMYYINTKTNKKSKNYDLVGPSLYISNNDVQCDYFILADYNNNANDISILNLKTDSIIKLDESIKYVMHNDEFFGLNSNSKTLIVTGVNNKYGVIDYSGNIVIDMIYEDIVYISDKVYAAKTNNKYGLINEKNETLLNFEYDSINVYDNFVVVTKNDKLAVLNKSYKVIVDYTIDVDSSLDALTGYYNGNYSQYYAESRNNILYLYTFSANYLDTFKYKENDKYLKSYTIDKKGIINIINNNINYIVDSSKDYNNYSYYFTYSTVKDKIIVTFYDTDFYEYYSFSIDLKYNGKVDYYVSVYEKEKCYAIEVNYHTSTTDRYYVDLINSSEVSSFTANYAYFDNGYGYVHEGEKLEIYKKDVLLETFDNIKDYVGDYMFITYKDKTYSIEKLEFKKDLSN
ncbi:MAG: WG repeat-containing protein [Tenericutes bacterium]|nr:WG repeat-containing protein [Mycoplasmatota bacterium]